MLKGAYFIRNTKINCLQSSDQKSSPGVSIKTEKKFGLKEDSLILCRNCGHPVTSPDKMIAVNGQHMHAFTNPAGILFEIGCFSQAGGCMVHGEPTLEFTWFAGFSWNYCVCSGCLIHLGWFYQSGSNNFYGLITELLVDTSTTH